MTASANTESKTIRLEIDGRPVEAREGAVILEVARREGIPIPTLCSHEGLEAFGGCRLCIVEVAHADRKGRGRIVTSCLYPVAEGLVVTSDSERVRKMRRDVLDLLLARCPASPEIRDLAGRHGVMSTSFARNETETLCILCGLCVRVCAAKGCHAINMGSRGFERYVARPFGDPPPDCIGCLSCAHICPTNAIPFEETPEGRKIWGRTFEMASCASCGRPVMPERQIEFEARRSGLEEDDFRICPACSIQKTAGTLRTVFSAEPVPPPAEPKGA